MSPYDHLVGTELASGSWTWDSDRALLYAVGVGAGLPDPLQERQFTTENTPGVPQRVIPSFLTLMGLPSDWAAACGWAAPGSLPAGLVHGEQGITLARPIPVAGTVRLSKILRGVYDKGTGALVVTETRMTLADTGEPLGTAVASLFVLGRGGFGGPRGPAGEPGWSRPARDPDAVVALPVGPNQSLLYRLSGDRTLHGTDPDGARADGFDRPVFYGLGSFGVACRALVTALCDDDPARLGHMRARFSRPVHPGDRLDTLIWTTPGGAVFQTLADGGRVVLDRGVFGFARPGPAGA